jgi:hypothetical protein
MTIRKLPTVEGFNCQICRLPYPESLKHEHHKKPKALGGSDDSANRADLCHTCHNNLHLLAYILLNPKRKQELEPTLNSIFPGKPELQREILAYSKFVAMEMALKKETKKEPDQEVRAVIELPARYMELLRLAGIDSPHINGKRRGVHLMIRKFVAEGLAAKFPLLKAEIVKYYQPKRKN